jgi:HEPN domain-containing protein
LCWKEEWEAAVKNLERAIVHIKRARDSMARRMERNIKTLEKLRQPSRRRPVEKLLERNREAHDKCVELVETLRRLQEELRNLIQTYGISRKS